MHSSCSCSQINLCVPKSLGFCGIFGFGCFCLQFMCSWLVCEASCLRFPHNCCTAASCQCETLSHSPSHQTMPYTILFGLMRLLPAKTHTLKKSIHIELHIWMLAIVLYVFGDHLCACALGSLSAHFSRTTVENTTFRGAWHYGLPIAHSNDINARSALLSNSIKCEHRHSWRARFPHDGSHCAARPNGAINTIQMNCKTKRILLFCSLFLGLRVGASSLAPSALLRRCIYGKCKKH